jgi:hypothetical protein
MRLVGAVKRLDPRPRQVPLRSDRDSQSYGIPEASRGTGLVCLLRTVRYVHRLAPAFPSSAPSGGQPGVPAPSASQRASVLPVSSGPQMLRRAPADPSFLPFFGRRSFPEGQAPARSIHANDRAFHALSACDQPSPGEARPGRLASTALLRMQ